MYNDHKPLDGELAPSTAGWARRQVERYEATDGAEGNALRGRPIIVLTSVGARTGKLRKTALMRVEHNGRYAVVASMGGAPKHPVWYYNLKKNPHVELQDGPTKLDYLAREVNGDEKATWWVRAVDTWPDYANDVTVSTSLGVCGPRPMSEIRRAPASHPEVSWATLGSRARAWRVLHAAWSVVQLWCLGDIWVSALTRRRSRRLWAGVAFLSVEGAALIVGHGDCPVGPMQAQWSDPVPFFELVLPHRAAKAAVPVLAIASVVGIVALALRPPGLLGRA